MIQIRDLHKSFARKKVLAGVDLDIEPGQITTIIGASGSGKSVLFKHIIGLLKPDSGSIRIDGEDITKLRERELYRTVLKFGMVFQGGALFDSLTVGENVAFGIMKPDLTAAEVSRIVSLSLDQVGLPDDINQVMPNELSGGMKKRVAIARAIAKDPQIIMYDEPTTGLDPIMADIINNLIIKVNGSSKITSIVITHNMVSAYKISDKIAVLYDGRIIESGVPDDIKNTRNPFVRQFIEGQADGPMQIR
ncbi:MAG: ABC transporter ATP-binding protein [Candidatus Aminicenantes bacterium]|nr:ABC transporter ATP-binding protein [Candidatus Aminicenantes bacterium]